MGHGLPDLIAGESQNRGEQLGDRVQDHPQGGLGGAALHAVPALAVQAVLDDVQIEARQLHYTEVVDGVGDHMELIVVIGGEALGDQLVQLGDGPVVQLLHLLGGHQMVGIEALQVAQAVAGGVAELQVVLAELLKDSV